MSDYGFLVFQGVETIDSNHLITPENIERLKQAKEAKRVQVCSLSLLLWIMDEISKFLFVYLGFTYPVDFRILVVTEI